MHLVKNPLGVIAYLYTRFMEDVNFLEVPETLHKLNDISVYDLPFILDSLYLLTAKVSDPLSTFNLNFLPCI